MAVEDVTSEAEPARGGAAVRARRERPERSLRRVSVAVGALAGLLGLARRGVPGLLLGGAGAALLARGAGGGAVLDRAVGRSVDPRTRRARTVHILEAFTIDRPAEELYARWRRLEELPSLMSHLARVEVIDAKRSRWVANVPALPRGTVSWIGEITADVPGERIAWRSVAGSGVDVAGSVTFLGTARGTVLRVELEVAMAGGRVGALIAKLFGEDPATQLREDLRRFKRVIETGEAITVEGQPQGTCASVVAQA